MNLKITPNNLAKLEKIFEEAKYILRFEKGTFNSGYCILEHKKVVVVNKFLNIEGRINTMLDILSSIQLEETLLSPESLKLYKQILLSRPVAAAPGEVEEEQPETPTGEATGQSGDTPETPEQQTTDKSGDTPEI